MIAAESLISVLYIWFALQCGVFARQKNEAQKAFAALVAVFVFCAFNGYAMRAVDAIFAPLPGWVHDIHLVTHWLLVCATAWLVLTNGAAIIRKALNGNDS